MIIVEGPDEQATGLMSDFLSNYLQSRFAIEVPVFTPKIVERKGELVVRSANESISAAGTICIQNRTPIISGAVHYNYNTSPVAPDVLPIAQQLLAEQKPMIIYARLDPEKMTAGRNGVAPYLCRSYDHILWSGQFIPLVLTYDSLHGSLPLFFGSQDFSHRVEAEIDARRRGAG